VALKKLDVFVGTWKFEWLARESLFGPAGTMMGEERFEWLAGGRFLQMDREVDGVAGNFKNLALIGYDESQGQYTQAVFNLDNGWSAVLAGPEENKSWTWYGRVTVEGIEFEDRCVWKVSPDGYSRTMRCEISKDGEDWTVTNEGTYTRVK
jgi:hypothetical protein